MRRRRRWFARARPVGGLVGVAVAGLVLAACTQSVPGDAGSGTTADPATQQAPGTQPVADLPVLSSRYAVDNGGGEPVAVRVDLNEVRVVEKVLQVTFTARNTNAPAGAGAPAPAPAWPVADFFSDGATNGDAIDTVDGVYVVDPVNAARHLPGRNPDGQCLCSGGLTGVSVLPGDGAVLTATFAAPAPDVAAINIYVPQVGEFTAVRVER